MRMTQKENEAADKRLRQIHKRDGGVTPQAVVEDAMREDSPLHNLFDWDVEKAAMGFWMERARELIRSFHYAVVVDEKKILVPTWVRDPTRDSDTQGYVLTVDLVKEVESGEKDHARAALLYEVDRARAVVNRVIVLAAALSFDPAMGPTLESLDRIETSV